MGQERMEKRKSCELDSNEANNSKRQRIQENPPASLDSLIDDCLLEILSYLPFEDLNSVAICSSRYRATRAHASLVQTRSGTIIISEECTLQSLSSKIIDNNWNQVFQGNRTHLKLYGFERLLPEHSASEELRRRAQLSGVSNLDLVGAQPTIPINSHPLDIGLCSLFPDLLELDLTSVIASNGYELCSDGFLQENKNVTKLVWKNCDVMNRIDLSGFDFRESSPNLQLYLDGCCFHALDREVEIFLDLNSRTDPDDEEGFAFAMIPQLEHLSIMNATLKVWGSDDDGQPVCQDILIKMVRCHPNLKWLRSDLSAENIAMLQKERPEITFESE